MTAIKAVFFDAAGTLIKPARGVGESYAVFAAEYGVQASAVEIATRFRTCFDAAPRLAFPGAAEQALGALERDWWKRLVTHIFQPWAPITRFDEFFDALFDYFSHSGSWMLYPEVTETLAALKQRRLRIGVISNFDSRLVPILNGLGIGSSFDDILVSSRVGYAKPDRKIFHAAVSRCDLRPEQGLHVGDSEINDRQGAIQAGLRGLLVDRRPTLESADPDVVTSLQAIIDLLA